MNRAASRILVEVSIGELLDKISILELKLARIADVSRREHVQVELDSLRSARDQAPIDGPDLSRLVAELDAVNAALWDIENRIRQCDRQGEFGDTFIQLARSVYRTNDRRSAIKRQINLQTGSRFIEEKDYGTN